MFEVETKDSFVYFLRAESREDLCRWVEALQRLRGCPVVREIASSAVPPKRSRGADRATNEGSRLSEMHMESSRAPRSDNSSSYVSSSATQSKAATKSPAVPPVETKKRDDIEVVADGEEDGAEIADAEFKDEEPKSPPKAASLSAALDAGDSTAEEEKLGEFISSDSKQKLFSIECAIRERRQGRVSSTTSAKQPHGPQARAESSSTTRSTPSGPSKARAKLAARNRARDEPKNEQSNSRDASASQRVDDDFATEDWDDDKNACVKPHNGYNGLTEQFRLHEWDQEDVDEEIGGEANRTASSPQHIAPSNRRHCDEKDAPPKDKSTDEVSVNSFDDEDWDEDEAGNTPFDESKVQPPVLSNSPGVAADPVSCFR